MVEKFQLKHIEWTACNIKNVIYNIHKTILKLICTYGIQLWGTASNSNTEILELFQLKSLLMIVSVPWYVPNTVIRRDLHTRTVKEEIRRNISQYSERSGRNADNFTATLSWLSWDRVSLNGLLQGKLYIASCNLYSYT
jgi:hypothetical protein